MEVIDGDGDADAAETRDELRRLLDGLGPVVLGPRGSGAAAGADDGGAGLAEGGGDAAAGPARRSRDDGHATAERGWIRRPGHGASVPALGENFKAPARAAARRRRLSPPVRRGA